MINHGKTHWDTKDHCFFHWFLLLIRIMEIQNLYYFPYYTMLLRTWWVTYFHVNLHFQMTLNFKSFSFSKKMLNITLLFVNIFSSYSYNILLRTRPCKLQRARDLNLQMTLSLNLSVKRFLYTRTHIPFERHVVMPPGISE